MLGDHAKNVVFTHEQVFDTVDFDFGAGVFGEAHVVARLIVS